MPARPWCCCVAPGLSIPARPRSTSSWTPAGPAWGCGSPPRPRPGRLCWTIVSSRLSGSVPIRWSVWRRGSSWRRISARRCGSGARWPPTTERPAILDGFRDARARQEMKVAFHLDLSRRSVSRGQLGQALPAETRLAWSARPEDPLLREKVDQTRLAFERGIASLDRDLRDRLASGDLDGARATVRWIRIAAPELDSFRRIQDSLANRKREVLLARLREVDAMVDAGREREAIEAVLDLGDSDPRDSLVVSSREALGRRLEALRRRRNLDGLAQVQSKRRFAPRTDPARSPCSRISSGREGGTPSSSVCDPGSTPSARPNAPRRSSTRGSPPRGRPSHARTWCRGEPPCNAPWPHDPAT